MPQPSSFRYDEAGPIATITLDRPDRLNALTFDVYAELRDLFAALGTRREVRAVVIGADNAPRGAKMSTGALSAAQMD